VASCQSDIRLFRHCFGRRARSGDYAGESDSHRKRSHEADWPFDVSQLNDAVNSGSGFGSFAFPNPAISIDDFVGAFRTKDIKGSVPTNLLEAIYTSVKRESLAQSLSTSEAASLREVIVTPGRLPTRLTLNQWSERIYISIPKPDSRFAIRLHGEGLAFDPPYLDFTSSTEETFRVMGTSLGARSLLMSRLGSNA
jgi:hypothetical protein